MYSFLHWDSWIPVDSFIYSWQIWLNHPVDPRLFTCFIYSTSSFHIEKGLQDCELDIWAIFQLLLLNWMPTLRQKKKMDANRIWGTGRHQPSVFLQQACKVQNLRWRMKFQDSNSRNLMMNFRWMESYMVNFVKERFLCFEASAYDV